MSDSGIGALRARRVPSSLHPREQKEAASEVVPNEAIPYIKEQGDPTAKVPSGSSNKPSTNTEGAGARRAYRARPTEDLVPLGVRVPRELDNKLFGLAYQLRLKGIRASKAELVALAIQGLPTEPTAALIRSLKQQEI